jgi:AcrR family transcriptional regulator
MASRRQKAPVDVARNPSLSRGVIVSAALELMDQQGVDGFSMRKLAARLEVSPQALYWHFKDKDDLCRAVVDVVREDVRIEVDASLSVADRIRAHMLGLRAHLSRHPCVVELGRRYLPTTAGEVTATGVELIQALGITDRETALRHYRALVWTVTGFSLVEHGAELSIHHTRVPGTSLYEVRLLAERGVPADGRRAAAIVDVEALFETAVNLFVAGLQNAAASS